MCCLFTGGGSVLYKTYTSSSSSDSELLVSFCYINTSSLISVPETALAHFASSKQLQIELLSPALTLIDLDMALRKYLLHARYIQYMLGYNVVISSIWFIIAHKK